MSWRLQSSRGAHCTKRCSLGEGLPGVRVKDSLLLPCGPSGAREQSCLERDPIPQGSGLGSAPLPPPRLRYQISDTPQAVLSPLRSLVWPLIVKSQRSKVGPGLCVVRGPRLLLQLP